MTVTGADHTGIVAAVTAALANNDVNIEDISQTLMGEYFTMILRIRLDVGRHSIAGLQEAMVQVEREQHLVVRVQSESLFTAMNQI